MHSVLGGKEREVLQRVQLVAAHGAGVGETGGNFVLPRALHPGLGGRLREGMECGITIRNYEAFEVGDVIESFIMEKFGG